MDQLRGLLAEAGVADGSPGAVRVVLVVGPGGQGKTTLAVHAAHLLRGEFPDGQLYASLLGATQSADPAEVQARFLRDLGADPARIPLDAEERAAHYRTRLAGRRMLIVLDDARDAEQVRPLLPGSASCAVLITARHWLPELAGGAVLDLDVLSDDEALALFTKIVGERRVTAEPGATGEVLTACAGLPLALRIAAWESPPWSWHWPARAGQTPARGSRPMVSPSPSSWTSAAAWPSRTSPGARPPSRG